MRTVISSALAGFAVGALAFSPQAAGAELTATEQLIRTEIVRLGGTWEGEAPASLIGLFGEKFSERHFDMLEHLRGAGMLSIIDVDVPPAALRSIARLGSVKSIEIQNSSFSGEGSAALRQLKCLARVRIYDCSLTSKGIRAISRIRGLEELQLIDVDLPSKGLLKLSRLKNLKALVISPNRPIDGELVAQLKSKLPGCNVEILQSNQGL